MKEKQNANVIRTPICIHVHPILHSIDLFAWNFGILIILFIGTVGIFCKKKLKRILIDNHYKTI